MIPRPILLLLLTIIGCSDPVAGDDTPRRPVPVGDDDDDSADDDDSGAAAGDDDDSEIVTDDDDDDDDDSGPAAFYLSVCNASVGVVYIEQIYSRRPGSATWILEWAPTGGGMPWGSCRSVGPYLPGEWSFLAVDAVGGNYCMGPTYLDLDTTWDATYPGTACQL